jgi:hypothetical protein
MTISSQFYTTVTYMLLTFGDEPVPSGCFNAHWIQPAEQPCDATHRYLAQAPIGPLPSWIDLEGDHAQADLERANFGTQLVSAIEHIDIRGKGAFLHTLDRTSLFVSPVVSSIVTEARFGLDVPLFTRVYFTLTPNQWIKQHEIQDHLQVRSIHGNNATFDMLVHSLDDSLQCHCIKRSTLPQWTMVHCTYRCSSIDLESVIGHGRFGSQEHRIRSHLIEFSCVIRRQRPFRPTFDALLSSS